MKIFTLITTALLLTLTSFSQEPVVEKLQPLSKNASKGYFYDAIQNPETGGIEVSYKFKGKAKDDKGTFETYYFDKDLNFSKQEESTVIKSDADKADYTKDFIYARVGGCSSFDVLGTTLHLSKRTYNYKWNSDKKKFTRKRTADVEIKPKNDDKRSFSGYAAFNGENGMMILVSSETKGEDKKMKKDFILLQVGMDLNIKEIPLPLEASQLVYSSTLQNTSTEDEDAAESDNCELCNSDMVFIFAPTFDKKSNTDYKKYTYLRVDKNGVVKENIRFDAPSPNLIITGLGQSKDGATYMFGSYTKDDKTFDQMYKEYSPLANPCYTAGANNRMEGYENKTEKVEMDFMSVLKFKDGKNEWIKNTSIDDLAKLVKTPAGQKKASVYKGKRLKIQYFNVLSNGDIFISGQLLSSEVIDKIYSKTYKDVICLQFTNKGELAAQYGVKPESIDDKKNVLYQIPQVFYPGTDGTVLYWNLLETNVFKGYADFYDAYVGEATFYKNYHPSMIKINTATKEIMDYQEIGKRKYLLNQHRPFIYNEKNGTIIYIGSDKKSNLWLAKYTMK